MNEIYVKEIILNSFVYIVRNNLQYEFVYDDDTEDYLQKEAENFGVDDLDKSLEHFEINAGELRTLLEDIEGVFNVELKEDKYWAEGEKNCIVSRQDAKKRSLLGTIAMLESDTKLRPGLTFREIAQDVTDLVLAKLNH